MIALLRAALAYAERGWRTLPLWGIQSGRCECGNAECQSPGKHPIGALVPHGLADASTDPYLLPEWWRQHDDANVGIATGAESGLVVLDVDVRDGKRGAASLAALVARFGPMPRTIGVRTGSGGAHFYFRHPGGGRRIGNKANLLPGLDVRGDGGYVAAPPSLHVCGGHWEWTEDTDDIEEPASADWLLCVLEALDAEKRPAAAPRPIVGAPLADRVRRASQYLARIPGAVSGAGGHDQTWGAALAVAVGFDLSGEVALDLLLREYNPRCEPPWSEKELRHKVADADVRATAPRGYLLDSPMLARPGNGRAAATIPAPPTATTTRDASGGLVRPDFLLAAPQVHDRAIEWLRRESTLAKVGTGIHDLDQALGGGLVPGELTLIYGATAHGKSTLALSILVNALTVGVPCLSASLEYVEAHHWRLIAGQRLGKRGWDVTAADLSGAPWLAEQMGLSILQSGRSYTEREVLDTITWAAQQGVRLAVFDPLDYLVPDNPQSRDYYGDVARYVRRLRDVIVPLNLHVIVVCPVRKDGELAGRNTLKHDAWNLLHIERDDDKDATIPGSRKVKVIVEKARRTGVMGRKLDLLYITASAKISAAHDPQGTGVPF